MKHTALALASVLGLAATAAPASAGDLTLDHVAFGFGFGDRGGRGFFTADFVPRFQRVRAPRVVADPVPVAPRPFHAPPAPVPPPAWGAGPVHDGCHRMWVPAHDVLVEDVVCEPAVYEDRCVPVYESVRVPVYDEVCVPVYEEVCVPVYGTRTVPLYDRVFDPVTGRVRTVRIGERTERVQTGERTERVQTGERKERVVVGHRTERVQVGERHEKVLVRAEACRTVTRVEHVPGRFVTCVHDRAHGAGVAGEVVTWDEYRAEMARVAAGPEVAAAPAPRGKGKGKVRR